MHAHVHRAECAAYTMQGNPAILDHLKSMLDERGMQYTVLLMSEISPTKLDMMPDQDVFVQVGL